VAVAGLLLGSVLAGILLRYRRPHHMVWLFWLTVVQWVAVIVVGAGSLID
jgi:predicted membrane protein